MTPRTPAVATAAHPSRRAFLLVGAALAAALPRVAAGADPEPAPRLLLTWGKRGDGKGEFDFPIGVAVGRDDEVFVSDFYNARVQRFSSEGKFRAAFPVLPNCGGIALDRDGNIYLSHFSAMKAKEERKPDRVSVYSRDGKLLRQWGKTGTGDGEFDYPGGLAVSGGGRVYVADQTNRRVQVFDREGKFLFKWGEYGTKEGQFGGIVSPKSRVGGPQFVALDRDGNVYTTEGSMDRVQKFTAEGKFLLAWGDKEDRPGGFGGTWQGAKGSLHGPVGICIDREGRVWVSAVSGRIQQFAKDGKYLRGLGGEGSEPGQFLAPHGVALDSRGNLYVVDAYNHRVQKFAAADK
jgi:sugar lactone lactonase YvrE